MLEEGDSDTRDACRKEAGSVEGSFADVKEWGKKCADDAFSFLSIQLLPSPILAWRKKKNRFTSTSMNFAQKDDLALCGDRFTLITD